MISIVIPVLNESATIGNLIQHLKKNSTASNISDIVIVDGGSKDDTLEIVQNFVTPNSVESSDGLYRNNNFKNRHTDSKVLDRIHLKKNDAKTTIILISSEKGRAKQLNKGAKVSNGNILYFLHADSFPPKNFDQLIIKEVRKGNNAGCFRMQFNSKHWWLRLASWFTQFSWRACRGGDQSQFITRALFDDIKGYNEDYIIYEDNILINELFSRNEFVVIDEKIITSTRLYDKYGVWKVQYHFCTIYVKRWLGASANELLSYYNKQFK